MSVRIGLDVGGTFTDAVVIAGGALIRAKSDTTAYDLRVGVFNALALAAERMGLTLEEMLGRAERVAYSTTIGTNAILERKGPKLGLITTKGFEDTILVGRSRNWADGLPAEFKYDRGRARRPEPLIPRERIVGVRERIDNLGNVIIPLDDQDVLEQVQKLVDRGVQGIVVVLLYSYVNPTHERRIRDLIASEYPDVYLGRIPVFLSSEVSPQAGEYRRSMTAILDAYLRLETERHLLLLSEDLREKGYRRPLLLVKNTGGLSSLSRTRPIQLVGSTCVAVVVGSAFIGRRLGLSNVVTTDMGGTSFDVGLVVEGQERIYDLDPVIYRWRIQLPYIAHWSIGAGGGSIARLEGGLLRVGPQSAGSNPGPACYGRGGEWATVTDADVVLGYIGPDYFLGGRLRVDRERAEKAVVEHVGRPLGLSAVEAAWQIKRLVDGFMGHEIHRVVAATSGQDPRDFVLFAFGGAGPVHAAGYAEAADVDRVATVAFGSVFGAFGSLTMNILQTYEKGLNAVVLEAGSLRVVEDTVGKVNGALEELVVAAERDLTEEGFDRTEVVLQAEASMRYGQQRHVLFVPLPGLRLGGPEELRGVAEAFNQAFSATFGKGSAFPEAGVEIVGVRVNAIGPLPSVELLSAPHQAASVQEAYRGRRQCYWGPELGLLETPVYRDTLPAEEAIDGPALVESEDTVTVVPPGWRYRRDRHLVGWIEKVSR
jgi:N-methylhydantoinase A/oxoprolinase/acetone carboxylase beta subunit